MMFGYRISLSHAKPAPQMALVVPLALLLSIYAAGCQEESKSAGDDTSKERSAGTIGSSALSGARGLKLCNTTSNRVGVAIGYKATRSWVSEGWWNVASHTCETLLKGKLINRYYYFYVIDYDRSGVWSGSRNMCTDDKLFTIVEAKNCVERGYKQTGFFEVDTGEESSWTVRLEDLKEAEAKE